MTVFSTTPIIQALHELRFDIQNALLKVKQDKPIDMSGIDERVEHYCNAILDESPELRDQAEPVMTDIITALEELAHVLKNAIDNDDDEDGDWEEDEWDSESTTPPAPEKVN